MNRICTKLLNLDNDDQYQLFMLLMPDSIDQIMDIIYTASGNFRSERDLFFRKSSKENTLSRLDMDIEPNRTFT